MLLKDEKIKIYRTIFIYPAELPHPAII